MAKPFPWTRCTALLCLSLFATTVRAHEEDGSSEGDELTAGHSQHGEAFNEGPRQAAYLMGGTGPIRFDVSSAVPGVQEFVEQGIGQLHGFWYFEAERSFRQAAMLDPDCAICYWGMAMANAENGKRAKEFLKEALERRSDASEREAMYIDALDDALNGEGDKKAKAERQIAAFQKLVQRYPDDLEAKAWLGYALFKHRDDAGKKHEEVDAALQEVLAIEPSHPVHHYVIHLWDAEDAKRALASAAAAGASAPAIAHMWHMPGHTYSKLKRYEDAVWQQEASARTDHAHMMRDGVMPDEIHNFAHNDEWLIRNLIHVGRWRDAIDLAKNMIELPRHPKFNTLDRRKSAYFGRVRLFEALKRYERWSELVSLTDSAFLEPTDDAAEQIRRLEHRGIAFAHLHHTDQADATLADLNARLVEATAKATEAKSSHEAAVADAKRDGKKPPKKPKRSGEDPVERLEKAIAAIDGHLLVEYGDYHEALPLLKEAGEDALTIARVRLLAGEKETALSAIDEEVKKRENEVLALAVQIEALWASDAKDQAKAAFEKLRSLSGSIQFGAAPLDRLAPVAEGLGAQADWRVPYSPPADFGARPERDALGPFRWSPSPAAEWKLRDHAGEEVALVDFRGKPLLVIFYLGQGCLHCTEQLKAFAPKAHEFEEAGISLVAVSTDSEQDLKLSIDNYEGGVPFPLLSNPELDVFKAYRAFDDFEQTPLHGTFLIDGDGHVIWRDVGYEPFKDVDFALKEARRLLEQDRPLPDPLAVVDLPDPSKSRALRVARLPRIDPAGIGGSLVISGKDLSDAALETFVRLARRETARAIVLTLDDDETTKAISARLLAQWTESDLAELRVVRMNTDELISNADWSKLLGDASGVWIAASNRDRFQTLAKQTQAREVLAEFVAKGNVIGAAGDGASLLAEKGFAAGGSEELADDALALLPESIVDLSTSESESPSRIERILKGRPSCIGYELDAGAAMVVSGRSIRKVGDGTLRVSRYAGRGESPVQVSLASEGDVVDMVAIRRAARDGMANYPNQAKPAITKVAGGTLILIGGGGMPDGIMRRFVDLAGGKEAHIVVLPTAMPDPIPEQGGVVDELSKLGAKTVTVLPERTLDKVESAEYIGALTNATGIWFGGGRQWRFVDAYLDTEAQEAMHDMLARGGVIMGSSAGASIQAEFLARGNPLGNAEIMADGYQRGLGFLPGAAVDQHFSERNRRQDMLDLVKRYPAWLGIGLDEATAIVVHGEIAEVIGRANAFFFAAAAAEPNGEIVVTELAAGGRYDLTRRVPVRPAEQSSAEAICAPEIAPTVE
ncbi:MAG TPA: Type 1 glutamine amidotransferase-like domain-containing protein [Pirellulaceae bacterium]|jgi:cyanophycinase|nr:Type 1 glutamine amidotransferase-like domain-containing protein [Pirellulaceae bacterium]